MRWIKISRRSSETRLPEILSEEEVLKLVQAADNLRDKALVMTLYESGCRVSELLTMKIKNVSFNENGATITVTGKTGPRRILLISSAPRLASWLEVHRSKDDPESFLWLTKFNRMTKIGYHPLSYVATITMSIASVSGIFTSDPSD